jgi:serine/threonine protein kinase
LLVSTYLWSYVNVVGNGSAQTDASVLAFSEDEADDPIIGLVGRLSALYAHIYQISAASHWWYFTPFDHNGLPKQGWKLHLSAIPADAPKMLDEIAVLLIEQRVRWKVCRRISILIAMSTVPSPLTQLGKFITIYPNSDSQAVELAKTLHAATRRFSGPKVPTDHRYADGSQVYYRYGGFEPSYHYDVDSALRTECLIAANGERVPDERRPGCYCPAWVTSPFPPTESPARKDALGTGLFGKNLMVKGVLRQSIKGGVYVAVRACGDTAVLKEARFGTNTDTHGRDARDRLRNEFRVLKKLSSLRIAPQPIEFFHAEGNAYLLMEHLHGISLRDYIERRNYSGDYDVEELLRICESIIEIVHRCHSKGVVIRDLTPNNLLVSGQECKLTDLEMAHLLGSTEPPFSGFTHGYIPLGSEDIWRESNAYDRYALGAVLFFIVTGIDPYLGPNDKVTRRTWQLLHTFLRDPALSGAADIAANCLTSGRNESLHQTELPRLGRISYTATLREIKRDESEEEGESSAFDSRTMEETATRIADYLHDSANWHSSGHLWRASLVGERLHPACFYAGSSGVASYLCELAEVTGKNEYFGLAKNIMDWTLSTHPFHPSETPPGLYFGYGGVPWIMARISNGTGDVAYLERARALAHAIACAGATQLDLTHGSAGIGLMCLELFRTTGDAGNLRDAITLARRIAGHAVEEQTGTWSVRNQRMWGFAHGTAGIAYFLLAAYCISQNDEYRYLAEKAGRALLQAAMPSAQGRGIIWTKGVGDESHIWTHWCNGASGIGSYFVAAAQILGETQYAQAALLAANSIKYAHGFGSCCQCHGLAGDGELLIEAHRVLGNAEAGQAASNIAKKLGALRIHTESGWVWPMESVEGPAPDFMTGYCGVYSFLMRLAHPELPRPLMMDFGTGGLLVRRGTTRDVSFRS